MPPAQVTIPLGGVDASGRPLPPTTTFLTGEPGAGLGNWEPYRPPSQGEAEQAPAGGALGNWEPYQAPPQAAVPEQPRQVGTGEAITAGLAHGATFGAAPAISGLAEASGMELPKEVGGALDQPAGMALARPFVGAYRLLTEGNDRVKAYTEARDKALKNYEEIQKQRPITTALASLAGGLAVTPALGPLGTLRGATVLGRVAQGAKVGAVTGGLTGAGEATSKGEAPLDVAKEAGTGAGVGGVLGLGLGGAIETGTGVARGALNLARGHRNPELEAARQVADVMQRGRQARLDLAADQPAIQAGLEAGTPVFNVDVGGAPARRLLRGATNVSPEAQDVASGALFPRFAAQTERAGEWVLDRFGGGDVGQTLDRLKHVARLANRGNYQRAQAIADRTYPGGIPISERLLSAPAVQQAVVSAAERAGNRSVADGLGAFNPRVTFENGIMRVNNRGGVQAFPDLQLWDYTQRELRDAARALSRQGKDDEAGALFALHSQLLGELDRMVPAFANARSVASRFFHANDALEAGENFVNATRVGGQRLRDPEVARMIASMSPAEQQLFRYGFVTELANKIGRIGDNQTINKVASTPVARRRLEIALGPDGAEEVLALLRIETLVDRARTATFGNSSSIQQLSDIAGGVAVGVGSEVTRTLNPLAWITGAILYAGRQLHHSVNNEVATNVARMLVSEDPRIYARGVSIAARNPVMRETLRRASELSARELISQVGPYAAAAGLATGASRLTGYGKPAAEPQHHYYEESPEQGASSFQQRP